MQRILVVDDEPNLLGVVSRTLRKAGFDVLEASNGQQAMDLLSDNHVDLILTDIYMPDVDGMEFTMRVKKRMPDTKIVVMSAGGMLGKEKVLEIASRLGATATLEKPFGPPELLATVNQALGPPPAATTSGDTRQASGEC